MKKKKLSTELTFVLGLLFIMIGVTFSVKANFGVSMIVAPAYVLQKFFGSFWPFFTMGFAEYCVQTFLLILMVILMRRFRLSFLCCFLTAVVYGFLLDGVMLLINLLLPFGWLWIRVIYYALGLIITGAGVSLMFHTYLVPQSYDYFVREVAPFYHIPITKFKLWYDVTFFAAAIILCFIFFGKIEIGEWWGTVVCTLLNGRIIGAFSKLYEKHFEFYDRFPWRRYFEITAQSDD